MIPLKPYQNWTQSERDTFAGTFTGTFSAEQKAILRQHWLVIASDEELAQVNAETSGNIHITGTETVDGVKVCNVDLLTEPELAANDTLASWQIIQLDPSTAFPQPEELDA